jgi:hypothetical protein
MPNGLWVPLLADVFGTLIGSIATITSALINRQPTLASILDSRIATLMQICEKTIGELRTEIAGLQEKIDIYERYYEGANGRDAAVPTPLAAPRE